MKKSIKIEINIFCLFITYKNLNLNIVICYLNLSSHHQKWFNYSITENSYLKSILT